MYSFIGDYMSIYFVFMLVFIMCKYFVYCFLLLFKVNLYLFYILRSFDFVLVINICIVKCV